MPKVSEEHRAARRQQIVEAALLCFARRGVQKTTMADICAQAGLSRGAVYVYFKSKQEILQAVSEESSRQNRDALMQAPDTPDLPGMLRAIADHGASLFEGPRGLFIAHANLALRAEAAIDESTAALVDQINGEVYALLAERIEARRQRIGDLGGLDSAYVGRCFVAFIDGLKLQMLEQPQVDVRRLIDTFWALVEPALRDL